MILIRSSFIREFLPHCIITAVILLSPYYRALYPDLYKFPFISMIFLAFLSYQALFFRKKQLYFELGFPVIIFLIFVMVYLLSVINAASKGSALLILFSYVGWATLFWMVIDLFNTESVREILIKLMIFSSAVLGLVGFLGALNLIPPTIQQLFGMSFWGLYFSERVSSTFQYPNTAASFYAITLFLSLYVLTQPRDRLSIFLYSIFNYVIFSALFFAFSRGANLAFIIALGFFFFFLPEDNLRVKSSSVLAVLLIPFLLFQFKLNGFLINSRVLSFWSLYLGGLFIYLVLTFGLSYLLEKYRQFFSKKVGLTLLLSILSLEIYLLFFLKPVEKGREISIETTNVIQRFIYYHDALKIGLQRPWFGWGGGGWAARYFAFQSSTYYSKFAHSFFLDTFVEVGFIGLFLLIFLIIYIFRTFFIKTLNHSITALTAFLTSAVFFIFVHSSIDLNFAMGAYHIITWTILGLLVSILPFPYCPIRIPIRLTFVITLILLIISVFWGNAEYYYRTGLEMKNQKDILIAARALENSTRFNPFLDDSYHQMSKLASELFIQSGQENFYDLAREKNRLSLALEPYNYEYHRQLADLLLIKNDFEQAWKEYNLSMELAPYVTGNYELILFFFLNKLENLKQVPNNQLKNWVQMNTQKILDIYKSMQMRTLHPVLPSEAMTSMIKDIQQMVGGE